MLVTGCANEGWAMASASEATREKERIEQTSKSLRHVDVRLAPGALFSANLRKNLGAEAESGPMSRWSHCSSSRSRWQRRDRERLRASSSGSSRTRSWTSASGRVRGCRRLAMRSEYSASPAIPFRTCTTGFRRKAWLLHATAPAPSFALFAAIRARGRRPRTTSTMAA